MDAGFEAFVALVVLESVRLPVVEWFGEVDGALLEHATAMSRRQHAPSMESKRRDMRASLEHAIADGGDGRLKCSVNWLDFRLTRESSRGVDELAPVACTP